MILNIDEQQGGCLHGAQIFSQPFTKSRSPLIFLLLCLNYLLALKSSALAGDITQSLQCGS